MKVHWYIVSWFDGETFQEVDFNTREEAVYFKHACFDDPSQAHIIEMKW